MADDNRDKTSLILAGVEWVGGWVHADGTPCLEYLGPVGSAPERGWWCTTHQMHVYMPDDRDPLSAELAAIKERTEAATPGPWWFDESDLVWRLHGVAFTTPPFCGDDGSVILPGQVMNRQILKAPKQGTPYAEYWPGEADAAFIVAARTDVPRLLAVVGKVLEAHRDVGGRCAWCRNPDGQRQKFPCGEYLAITRELTGKAADDG